ncbi:MAG: alpha/beta hydrolase [Bdellovibrionales bacterium]|nr:alpha/beta hydrolase [Bdellovibrionales bacterium]
MEPRIYPPSLAEVEQTNHDCYELLVARTFEGAQRRRVVIDTGAEFELIVGDPGKALILFLPGFQSLTVSLSELIDSTMSKLGPSYSYATFNHLGIEPELPFDKRLAERSAELSWQVVSELLLEEGTRVAGIVGFSLACRLLAHRLADLRAIRPRLPVVFLCPVIIQPRSALAFMNTLCRGCDRLNALLPRANVWRSFNCSRFMSQFWCNVVGEGARSPFTKPMMRLKLRLTNRFTPWHHLSFSGLSAKRLPSPSWEGVTIVFGACDRVGAPQLQKQWLFEHSGMTSLQFASQCHDIEGCSHVIEQEAPERAAAFIAHAVSGQGQDVR